MQETTLKKFVDNEMKHVEINQKAHKALKAEAHDREVPVKILANDIIEGWLDSNRPDWKKEFEKKEEEDGAATDE